MTFLEVALAAWGDFQRTGLHVTHDEMKRWLESWGTDRETAAPGFSVIAQDDTAP